MKYLIYFVLGVLLLFYSLPYLSVTTSTEQTIFTVSWLFFALCSIGGNLYAFLNQPNKKRVSLNQQVRVKQYKRYKSGSH